MPADFLGLKVHTFQSRHAQQMIDLIQRYGGNAVSVPTMQEVPLDEHQQALAFGKLLFENQIDILILQTGVGTQLLLDALQTQHQAEQINQALTKIMIVTRGPKPVAVLRKQNLKPTYIADPPNTWEDVLAVLDAQCPVAHKKVAVQEYGQTNQPLLDALAQRGAKVTSVCVYQWQLPNDLNPIKQAINDVIAQKVDMALFTSATQVRHLFEVATQMGKAEALRDGFKRVCIGSIGPVASLAIEQMGIKQDYEPDEPHMTNLVGQLARRGRALLNKKRVACANQVDANHWLRTDMRWEPKMPEPATIADSVFMKAVRCEPTPYTPIWLMRQIGRYQREYRQIKAKMSFLELCKSPQLCAEVALMSVDRLGVDAAIIFADILPVVQTLGMKLDYLAGIGPVIDNPVRDRKAIDALKEGNADELGFVYEALALARVALKPNLALIGFAGSPFTVASYMIEGGKSTHFTHTKTLMYNDPTAWHALMTKLVDVLIDYLIKQFAAGADIVQLFDSWGGVLGEMDYRQNVLPHVQRLITAVRPHGPVINFATGNPMLLPTLKEAGGDVIGADWRIDLDKAWQMIGHDTAIMGNLDPAVLFASPKIIRQKAKAILDLAAGRPGHIFNLGHGILPDMSPVHIADLVDCVHELSAR